MITGSGTPRIGKIAVAFKDYYKATGSRPTRFIVSEGDLHAFAAGLANLDLADALARGRPDGYQGVRDDHRYLHRARKVGRCWR
jgi:hypothetical protein